MTKISLAVLLAVGCGGSSSPGSFSGSVHGNSVSIADAVSAGVAVTDMNGGTQHEAFIVMAASGGLCSDAATNTAHPTRKFVVISLVDVNGTTFTSPSAAGSY